MTECVSVETEVQTHLDCMKNKTLTNPTSNETVLIPKIFIFKPCTFNNHINSLNVVKYETYQEKKVLKKVTNWKCYLRGLANHANNNIL